MWAWISGASARAGWVCDGGVQISFCGAPRGVQGAADGGCKIKVEAVHEQFCGWWAVGFVGNIEEHRISAEK